MAFEVVLEFVRSGLSGFVEELAKQTFGFSIAMTHDDKDDDNEGDDHQGDGTEGGNLGRKPVGVER